MSDQIKVIPLAGLDEDGRDCYVIEINQDIFVLDAGLSLPDKSLPGVDAILPNFDYLIKNKDRVRAYILTQGHDENIGGLEYFYDRVPAPIYCSRTTKNVLLELVKFRKSKVIYNFVEVEPSSEAIIANRKFSFFQTPHNISATFGVAIDTDKGNIIFTGDFIVEFSTSETGFKFDLKALEKIAEKPTFLLISESKSAHKEGYCSPRYKVYSRVKRIFSDEQKRIFICCFWQNFYRIKEICQLAKENGKKIFFYNDFTKEIMENIVIKTDWNILTPNDIVKNEDLLRVRNQDVVILLLGKGADLYDEVRLIASNRNADRRIVLDKDDIVINAALATPTLETVATRSVDMLYRTGCEVEWLKPKEISSMHARQDDLKFFLSFFKPKYYLPVRGSYVNLMANAKLAASMGIGLNHLNVFILDNGFTLQFDEQGRSRIFPNNPDEINVSPVFLDGTGISRRGTEVVEDRRKLGQDGVVVIAASISLSQKKIIAGPDCQMRGFVYVKEAEPLLKNISKIFVETINLDLADNTFSQTKTLDEFKEKARRFIKRENGRDPLILPTVIELD